MMRGGMIAVADMSLNFAMCSYYNKLVALLDLIFLRDIASHYPSPFEIHNRDHNISSTPDYRCFTQISTEFGC